MRKRYPVAVALGISLISASAIAAPAQTPRQFDLICNDGSPVVSLDDLIRVDLDKAEWCGGDCTQMQPMTVTPDRLTLRDEHDAAGDATLFVNRSTGILESDFRIGSLSPKTMKYLCRVAPYTGPGAPAQF
jgi:hypothetical protein